MKVLFLLNGKPYFDNILGKFSEYLVQKDVEVVVYVNSKFSKYKSLNKFSKKIKVYERSYRKHDSNTDEIMKAELFNWEVLYESWDRKTKWYNVYDFSNTNSKQILLDTYLNLSEIIETEKIDMIVDEPPANLLSEMAYYLSLKHNIKYFGLMQSRIPNKIDIYDRKYSNSTLTKEQFYNVNVTEEEREILKTFNENFVNKKIVPTYMDDEINSIHKVNLFNFYFNKISKLKLYFDLYKKGENRYDYETESYFRLLIKNFLISVQRKYKRNNIKKYEESFDKVKREKYYVFPLHVEPEASVSGQAMYYSEILSTIKYVAFSLPFPYILLIKEHPGALGIRDKRFYRELKKIPNVFINDVAISSDEVIRHSQGVITLTSTVGLEAALQGKQVIVLGDVFYTYHPLCHKISSYNEISSIIRKGNTIIKEDLEEINVKFWKLYMKTTIDGNVLTEKLNNHEMNQLFEFITR